MSNHILHLSAPADEFEMGTPIGAGSLGAMLRCDPKDEKIWLTEESLWSGSKLNTDDPAFKDKVQILRNKYLSGDMADLDDVATEIMKGSVHTVRSLEYAGALCIHFNGGKITDYSRDLCLNEGFVRATCKKNGKAVTETAFADFANEVIAVNFHFEEPADVSYCLERENMNPAAFSDNILSYTGKTQEGEHRFAVGIKLVSDSKPGFTGSKVTLKQTEDFTLFIAVATEFNFGDNYRQTLLDILEEADDFDGLMESHCKDFSGLFNRSDIRFNYDAKLDALPMDKRLAGLKHCKTYDDFGIAALYFAFGKYLTISSSREGTLPANLQGVWVEKLNNPWNADYHTNINLQMNYWLCEQANLSECHLPLFDYLNTYILPSGEKTAAVNYGCKGLVEHHLSDIYGFTCPADGLWGIWPMGGAWLSTHMWEHYLFTEDKEFLRDTAYRYMKDCAEFFLDYMFEDKNGYLISGPSMSPENEYYIETPKGRKEAYLCFSPTMDVEIITAVLRNYIDAEKILHIDAETAGKAENAIKKLPPLKVGKRGQLMEWMEDYEEPEPGHRHISHAFGLYPDNLITEKTPELYAAIKKTLELRLQSGGGHTGWSRAWLINLFARLKDGENAWEHIRQLFVKSTKPSLLDIHPPFQIDGNFGGAAGIAETLLQSHEGYISLLPAVPKTISGHFSGLKARGNVTVGADFVSGMVTAFTLSSYKTKEVTVKIPQANRITDGKNIFTSDNGFFTLRIGEKPINCTVI